MNKDALEAADRYRSSLTGEASAELARARELLVLASRVVVEHRRRADRADMTVGLAVAIERLADRWPS